MDVERTNLIRQAIAAELQLPPDMLHDGAMLQAVGLDSLALAQSVVAVEEALAAEVDTEALSTRLAPEMTVAALIAAIEASLVAAPVTSAAR